MLSSGVCGENSINDKPTYALGWQASRLDAVSNMDLAGSDHSSCGQTYSSFCRQRPLLPRTHLLLLLPAKITPPMAVPTLLAARRDHSSRGCTSSCCCRQRLLLLPPPGKWGRFGNEWRRHKSRRRMQGQANRQLAFCITRSSRRYTALLLGSCWVGMLASRSGGPTLLHPTP